MYNQQCFFIMVKIVGEEMGPGFLTAVIFLFLKLEAHLWRFLKAMSENAKSGVFFSQSNFRGYIYESRIEYRNQKRRNEAKMIHSCKNQGWPNLFRYNFFVSSNQKLIFGYVEALCLKTLNPGSFLKILLLGVWVPRSPKFQFMNYIDLS